MGFEKTKEEINLIGFDELKEKGIDGIFMQIVELKSKKRDRPFEFVEIQTEDGKKHHITLTGHLKYCLDGVNVGTRVLIEYKGTKVSETEFGEKDVHLWSVSQWVD